MGVSIVVESTGKFVDGKQAALHREVAGAQKEQVNDALRAAAEGEMAGILAYSEEPLVSMDLKEDNHSSIVDGQLTNVIEGTIAGFAPLREFRGPWPFE
jgi:glyceraldehyde-3-phosphate dehydrogenase/erythrose-4-phosphate dehydrogenase